MALTYYGFEKYEHQQTRSFVSGDLMGGTAISTMPNVSSAGLKAGRILINLGGTVTAKDTIAEAFTAIDAITVASTAGTLAGHIGTPQIYLLAEDIPQSSTAISKFVAYEVFDVNNLVVRKAPADTPVYIQ